MAESETGESISSLPRYVPSSICFFFLLEKLKPVVGSFAEPGGDGEEEDGEAQRDDRTLLAAAAAASPLPPEAKWVDGHGGAEE